jgi:hypothetical protein
VLPECTLLSLLATKLKYKGLSPALSKIFNTYVKYFPRVLKNVKAEKKKGRTEVRPFFADRGLIVAGGSQLDVRFVRM